MSSQLLPCIKGICKKAEHGVLACVNRQQAMSQNMTSSPCTTEQAPALAMKFPEAVRERGKVCSGSSAAFEACRDARSVDGGLRSSAVGTSDRASLPCTPVHQHQYGLQ